MFSRPITDLVSLSATFRRHSFLPYFHPIRKGFCLVGLDRIDHLTKSATVGRGRSVGRSRTREVAAVDSMNVKRTFVVSQGERQEEGKKVTG